MKKIRDVTEIQEDQDARKVDLDQLQSKLSKNQARLNELHQRHDEILSKDEIDLQKLKTLRGKIRDITDECETNEIAQNSVEGKIEALEQEKKLSMINAKHVDHYKTAVMEYLKRFDKIQKNIDKFNILGAKLQKEIEGFVKTVYPLEYLNQIQSQIEDIDLRCFVKDKEIKMGSSKNLSFMETELNQFNLGVDITDLAVLKGTLEGLKGRLHFSYAVWQRHLWDAKAKVSKGHMGEFTTKSGKNAEPDIQRRPLNYFKRDRIGAGADADREIPPQPSLPKANDKPKRGH